MIRSDDAMIRSDDAMIRSDYANSRSVSTPYTISSLFFSFLL